MADTPPSTDLWRLSGARPASSAPSIRSPSSMTKCCSSSSTRPRNCGSSRSSHELDVSREPDSRRRRWSPVHKSLSRVSRIQAVMTLSWDVLATMTPADYTSFRHVLGTSSGFQSAQFRAVRIQLGLKDGGHLRFQEEGSEPMRRCSRRCERRACGTRPMPPLARAGFDVPARGARARLEPSPTSRARRSRRPGPRSIATPTRWWPFYQLAEKLVDIDDAMATWRHKHVVTVERIIGVKRGTGGTAGVAYLQSRSASAPSPSSGRCATRL